MTFLSPLFFLLFLLVPVIVWMDFRNRKKGVYFRSSEASKKIYKVQAWRYFYFPLVLKIIIVTLFVCILANPVTTSIREEVSKK